MAANRFSDIIRRLACLTAPLAVSVFGCAAGPRVDLSAARSLHAVAASLDAALREYHAEIQTADAARRSSVINAFLQRTKSDHADEQRTAAHMAILIEALNRIRDDAEVENARQSAALDHLRTLREIAQGLRRAAVEAMTLDDELRRYVFDLLQPATPDNESRPTSGYPQRPDTRKVKP